MREIRKNLPALSIITLINGFILIQHIRNGNFLHGIGYFLFFYIAILTIHVFTTRIKPTNEIQVKSPATELALAVLFAFMGILFLFLTFYVRKEGITLSIFTKTILTSGSLLFSFPVGIFIYLLLRKYKLLNLGFNIQPKAGLLSGLIIWALTGLFAMSFNYDGLLWKAGYKELGGVIGIITNGIIGAALMEEFSRFTIQSRFVKIWKTDGINIIIATILWAFMHFPVTYFKGAGHTDNLMYCVQIIPIGVVWGYMTQRTKSILPSTLAHGLNLWGLQNG